MRRGRRRPPATRAGQRRNERSSTSSASSAAELGARQLRFERPREARPRRAWIGHPRGVRGTRAMPPFRVARRNQGSAKRSPRPHATHDLTESEASTAAAAWDEFWASMRPVELTPDVEQTAGALARRHRFSALMPSTAGAHSHSALRTSRSQRGTDAFTLVPPPGLPSHRPLSPDGHELDPPRPRHWCQLIRSQLRTIRFTHIETFHSRRRHRGRVIAPPPRPTTPLEERPNAHHTRHQLGAPEGGPRGDPEGAGDARS